METRIAVVADTHFSATETEHPRRGDIGDVLFRRAVRRINTMIKPDIVLILGDVVDDGNARGAQSHTERMRGIADELECPYIAIPGNHDVDPHAFYKAFRRPPDVFDTRGVRFMAFIDPEQSEYNARRTPRNLARMAYAREGYSGPVVMLQHVPLFPPGTTDCPYKYTNADAVIGKMREHGITLSVSGHWHEGFDLIERDGMHFLAAPGLCVPPFPFLEIAIRDSAVEVKRHELKMPEELGLVDCHVHTQFAYCADDIVLDKIPSLAADFGLAGVGLAEHTGSLYFDNKGAWSVESYRKGIASAERADCRLPQYVEAAREQFDAAAVGLEVDCDLSGRPMMRDEDRAHVGFLVGAIHLLAERLAAEPDAARMAGEYMAVLERFVSSGMNVLAHPLRVFSHAELEAPGALFEPVVRLLRENDVAAEINCRNNRPPPEFFRLCIDAGVKLVLGSDAHELAQIGELAPHLELLRQCGYDGDLEDILVDPRGALRHG